MGSCVIASWIPGPFPAQRYFRLDLRISDKPERGRSVSCSVVVVVYWLSRVCPRDSPGKNTGLGCRFLNWNTNSSVQFNSSVLSDSLPPHRQQHARLPCPSPTSGACSNSCPLSRWCHPTISSLGEGNGNPFQYSCLENPRDRGAWWAAVYGVTQSQIQWKRLSSSSSISSSVVPFSSCLQSFPALGSFPMNQFFTSGGQSIGVSASASVLPMNIQDWFSLGLTGWIFLQSKGLSRVFSNTTVQKASILWHSAFIIVQLSHPYMTTGKNIVFTWLIFVGKVMSLLLNILSRLVIAFFQGASVF